MARRQLVPILRQSLLVCRDSLRRFLLLRSDAGALSLPMFHSLSGETFKQGLERGASELNLPIDLRGILRVETGNNGQSNYYRCIYYATSPTASPTSTNSQITFKHYEQLAKITMNLYARAILEEVNAARSVYSLDFFRQKHVQRGPMPCKRKIMVEI